MKFKILFLLIFFVLNQLTYAQNADLNGDIHDEFNWYGVVADTIEFDMEITNSGNTDASEFYTGIYLSTNTTHDGSDVLLDEFRTGSLRIDETVYINNRQVIIPSGTTSGTYYIIAFIDKNSQITESNEGNNVPSQEIEVITSSMLDFQITNLNLSPDPLNTTTATISYTVKNNSGSFLPEVPVDLYFSEDASLDNNDTRLDIIYSNNESGSSVAVSKNVEIPNCQPAGNYYIIAVVDKANSLRLEYLENNENNNISSHLFAIADLDTDLIIEVHEDAVSPENTYSLNDEIPLKFLVTRVGSDELTSGNTKIYLSDNNIYEGSDELIATISYNAEDLDCGFVDNVSESFTVTNSVTDGKTYFIAIVEIDDGFDENDESNNTAITSAWISKSMNLSLSSCDVSPTSFNGNETFTIDYDITNNGSSTLGKVYTYLVVKQGTHVAGKHQLKAYTEMVAAFNTSETNTVTTSSLFNSDVDILETNCTFSIEAYVKGQVNSSENDDYIVQSSCSKSVTLDLDIDYSISSVFIPSNGSDVFISEEDKSIGIDILTNNTYNFDVFANTNQDLSFYISTDDVLDGADTEINVFNSTYSGTRYWKTLTMPSGFADGYYYLIAKIDSDNAITETDENNNTFSMKIYLTYPIETESQEDGDWLSINWSNGMPDGDYYEAVVSNSVIIDENLALKSLLIKGEGNLTVQGQSTAINIDEDLSLKPNASLIGQAKTHASKTYYETFISKYSSSNAADGWHFLSFPSLEIIAGNGFSDYEPSNNIDDFYSWDATNGNWVNYFDGLGETVVALAGKGYLVAYGTETTKTNKDGLSFHNGDISTDLIYVAGADEGYNLIGNPYPSSINWNLLIKTGSIDGSFYIVNPADGTYLISNGSNGDFPTGTIPATQGFLVKANASGQTLTFTETAQIHSDDEFNKAESSATNPALKITLSTSHSANSTYVLLSENSTMEFDNQIDAYKLFGFAIIPQVYTQLNDIDYAINSFDLSNEVISIPLGIHMNQDEDLSFNIAELEHLNESIKVELEDKILNQIINLREQSSYSFRGIPSDEAERFLLHFSQATGVENIEEQKAQVYIYDGQVYVRLEEGASYTQMAVYDLSGRLIKEHALNKQRLQSFDFSTSKGAYLIKLSGDHSLLTKKITL